MSSTPFHLSIFQKNSFQDMTTFVSEKNDALSSMNFIDNEEETFMESLTDMSTCVFDEEKDNSVLNEPEIILISTRSDTSFSQHLQEEISNLAKMKISL